MAKYRGDRKASHSKGRKYDRDPGETRLWFCRSCGTKERTGELPLGWYRLERKTFQESEGRSPWLRLGLYCSIACINDQTPRLRGIEAEVDRGELDPAGFDAITRRAR
ncbi:hypothetical protein [Nocardiopsis composta]|uniref:Uncharacterized protein n=1 Tax=Nocardiopsis composta TaxID=157465 RepID=A0A7W8QS86_9ACTN|nr:hypothetical protein [Nocardiopsis composta]MBB5435164.1 hypothetical protein [Nocardiopsis composta]